MIAIQILDADAFIKSNKETFIKADEELMINSYGETLDVPEDYTSLSDEEIIDELNQNPRLLEQSLNLELVFIRNVDNQTFLNYVKSFN